MSRKKKIKMSQKFEDLTLKQEKTMEVILGFQKEHNRYPTYGEIGAILKTTAGTIQSHIEALAQKGFLTHHKGSRRMPYEINKIRRYAAKT